MKRSPVFLGQGYLLLCLAILCIAAGVALFKTTQTTVIAEITEEVSVPAKPIHKRGLFTFDPNTIDSNMADTLDIPRRVMRNLFKYRAHGGVFRTKNDVLKIYGLTDSIFLRLSPYICIGGKYAQRKKRPYTVRTKHKEKQIRQQSKAIEKVELNTATADDLRIRGIIGKARAKAIIGYRNYLGGFYSLAQLEDVYSLPDSLIDTLAFYYTVDTASIEKKELRQTSWKELVSLPFINRYDAKHILQALRTDSSIALSSELIRYRIIDSSTYQKLHFYYN